MPITYYKYRSIQNLKRALDIVVQRRVYAAYFTDMNDPMEGVYDSDSALVNENDRWRIGKKKLMYRIVALSRTFRSTLMWAYYADGHKGMVLGLTVVDKRCELRPVIYKGPARIRKPAIADAMTILSTKYAQWKHEREVRGFTSKRQRFVKVRVTEIILGIEASKATEERVRAVAKLHCPQVIPRRMQRKDLEGVSSNRKDTDA
jgi:hypothetical protein